ncbi:hypothetical protein [Curvivirga aplysinae]|uniref:hypothetical protein n=1 Tax=Curvivirga aplysinae TaxID=2529852 RepID=UPI0012BB5425|nr:hypothetical protein [Curvivirga aplysinae]MTI10201.1 hypothetical protein [Curvivirga aplysinae]
MVFKYYITVFKLACKNLLNSNDGWRKNFVWFFIQTSFFFLLLYMFPVFGDIEDELKLGVLGAVSICASALFMIFGEVLFTPARIDASKSEALKVFVTQLERVCNEESFLQDLSNKYFEGLTIYDEKKDFSEWIDRLDIWASEVETLLSEHCSISTLHSFRQSGNGASRVRDWEWEEISHNDAWEQTAKYSSKLFALDDIIKFRGTNFLGIKRDIMGTLDEYSSTGCLLEKN